MNATTPTRGNAILDLGLLAAVMLVLSFLDKAYMPETAQLLTICGAFLAAWALLGWRGQTFADVGLRRPARIWTIPVWTIVVLATVFAVMTVVQPMVVKAFGAPDYSRFQVLIGNTERLVISLFAVWVTAAFFEEMVFRGFALNRLTALLGDGRMLILTASLINAALFSLGHAYQGMTGIILTGTIGFIFSIFYFLTGRNLWALILAHGLIDTFSLWQIYSLPLPPAG